MHISDLKDSKFLKKEDCTPPILVTIKSDVIQENVAKEGAEPELKWALHFQETDKPMILNATNGQLIARIAGSENTEDWIGQKIVLFNDPNVSFQGKLIGGIRVRAPKGKAAMVAKPVLPTEPDDEDQIPF